MKVNRRKKMFDPYEDGYLDGLKGDKVKPENLYGSNIDYARGFIVGRLVYLRDDTRTKLSALEKAVGDNEKTINMLYKWMCEKEGIEALKGDE